MIKKKSLLLFALISLAFVISSFFSKPVSALYGNDCSVASGNCDRDITVNEGESTGDIKCAWAECGGCPQYPDACSDIGAYRCVIGGEKDVSWVARCDTYSSSCDSGYWNSNITGAYGPSELHSRVCSGDALTPTPFGTPGPTGTISPTPIGGQCQNGPQDRDQDTWLICECNNGCKLKNDTSEGGGGEGWVCEENCRTVPIGTRPSSECNQIDYVHEGTSSYCGVAEINCPDTCKDNDTTPTPGTSGPSCNMIELLDVNSQPITGTQDAALRPGDAIKLKCGATKSVDHYEFRITGPQGTDTIAHSDNSATSEIYVIKASGDHTAQCRICTSATSCQSWE